MPLDRVRITNFHTVDRSVAGYLPQHGSHAAFRQQADLPIFLPNQGLPYDAVLQREGVVGVQISSATVNECGADRTGFKDDAECLLSFDFLLEFLADPPVSGL